MPDTLHTIGIAGLKVARGPELIRTVLGSCVGVTLFDRTRKLGGMAHVILPESSQGAGDRGKFADTAVDWLLEEVLKAGGQRDKLAAKIAGGARMFGTANNTHIGERNIDAVRNRLRKHNIPLIAEAIGGGKGRKMTIDLETGNVDVQIIGETPQTI
ncbi:MAG: chemotaxis protein CheD [Planctomycetes bacterium]|nr:chemotaxis protein CheD [Planctomycetota bacterium]